MKPRWLFFTLFASYSVPGRFTSIFYQEHGISETHIGVIMAIAPLITMFCSPVFCNLSDRVRRREDVALTTYAGYIIAFSLQIFAIPSLNIISDDYCFPFLLIVRVILSACSVSYPIVSAIAISQLRRQYGRRGYERFGHERLWGAISWAVCSIILGALLDLVTTKLWLIHGGSVLFGMLFLGTLYRFKKEVAIYRETQSDLTASIEVSVATEQEMIQGATGTDSQTKIIDGDSSNPSVSTMEAVCLIMCSDGIIAPVFFNLIFWLAGGMSLVENFLFLFFENELSASNFLCGLSVVVTVVAEIPIFAKAPDLLEMIGASGLAMIGSSSFSLRGIGYSLAPNAWIALLNEPLHGITFGAFHTATVAYIAKRSPTKHEATSQSVLQVVQSLGKVLGTSTGGYVMQRFGSKVLYGGAALVVLAATLVFGIVDRFSQWNSRDNWPSVCEGKANTETGNERVILKTASD